MISHERLDEEWLWDWDEPVTIEHAILFKQWRELSSRPKFDDYSIGDEISLKCTWICPKCGYKHDDFKMMVSTWTSHPLLQCIRIVGKEQIPSGFGGMITVDKRCGGLGPTIYLRKTAHAILNEKEAQKRLNCVICNGVPDDLVTLEHNEVAFDVLMCDSCHNKIKVIQKKEYG